MENQPARHEFIATIEGIELPAEIVHRVTQSIQKAVLVELANIDLRGPVALQIPPGIHGGHTNGIRVVRESEPSR